MAKVGRPSKYKPEYCKTLIDYFSVEPYREIEINHRNKKGDEWTAIELRANDLPMFGMFAVSIGVNQDTLHEWKKVHAEFSEAFKIAKELQENFLAINTLLGLYNSTFAIFTAKNILGWRDQKHLEHTSPPGKPVEVNVTDMTEDERKKAIAELMLKREMYLDDYEGGLQ